MVQVDWIGGMAFEGTGPSGGTLKMDAYPEAGGQGHGPTPLETLLMSAAACSAMDVLSILKKKQQTVTSYRIEVEGERAPEGQWPRPYLSIVIRHLVQGENLDPAAVERSVQLSDEKYCSVLATLRAAPNVTSEWRIVEAAQTV
jgi:putative redox protein